MAAPKSTQPSDQKKHVDLVEIVRHGTAFVLPEDLTLDRAIEVLEREKNYQNQRVALNAPIEGFVTDVAWAFYNALKDIFGWAHGVPQQGFFGDSPPRMLTVYTSPTTTVQVPWGVMAVPGLDGYLETEVTRKDGRLVFVLSGNIKRGDMGIVDRIVERTRQHLRTGSLYKGKAFRLRLTEDDGSPLPLPEPRFFEINTRLADELVFNRDIEAAIHTNVFTPIEHTETVRRLGIPMKRGILLTGTYGTGKSMTSTVVAHKATDHGWTFILVERQNDLVDVLRLAREYAPAVVFCEDIDRVTHGRRSMSMDELLNVVDGVEAKSAELMVIFTTNDVESINQAMLRPGRLDAVIEVRPPDAEAVQRLMVLYGRGLVAHDADLAEASAMMAGEIPAVVQEVVERSKLAAIRRDPHMEFGPGSITGDDLVTAAHSMRNQLDLLRPKRPDTRSERVKAATILAEATLFANGDGRKPVAVREG